jgi:hypothetical protein
MGGVSRVETVPGEVAGNVGTHEVHTQKPKLGLELEYEQADVRDLLNVVRERRGCGVEVAQVGRMTRRAQVRIGPENRVAGRQRENFGAPRSSEAGDENALQLLWGWVNGTVTKADLMPAAPR